jgi:hypothetical protein
LSGEYNYVSHISIRSTYVNFDLCKTYLKCLDNFMSEFSTHTHTHTHTHTKQRERKTKKCSDQRESANSFRVTSPKFSPPQSFRFLSVGIHIQKKILVYSTPNVNEETLHQRTFDACQTTRSGPMTFERRVTAHDQTWPCVHWFRWRTFWASVVNYHSIFNKKSAVIKLAMCAINVLCQL